MFEEHVFELLPAYALDALDEDELIQVSRHLAHCAQCRSELAAYERTVDQLPRALQLRTPPEPLKAKIMRKVSGSALNPPLVTVQPARQPEQGQRPSFGALLRDLFAQPAGKAFAFSAIVLMILLLASSIALWQRVNTLEAKAPASTMQLVHLAGTDAAPQTRGYLMVFKNENYGTLVVEDAPPLKNGYQYQLWLIKDGERTSGGVFSVSADGYASLEVASDQPLDTYPSFGITIEPAGGSPGPTGKKVLGGSL